MHWSAPGRAGQTNWVGLYRAGTPADTANLLRPTWVYVRQDSGSHDFQVPAQPGQYVFRLYYGDAYDLRATSNTFTIGNSAPPPPPPPPPPGQAAVSVSPMQVAPGGTITVQWSAPGRTGQTNWVGLYRAGTTADSANLLRPTWVYIKQESGTHEFQAPAQPGQYIFRLYYGDAYDLRATSSTFTVGGGNPPPPPPPVARSLTGAWVHSADPAAQTPDSKVIIIQDGNRITLTQTYKMEATRNQWVTLVCSGTLSGADVNLACDYAPGGNPLGFGSSRMSMRLSADGNHLDGTLSHSGGSQGSHYSRVP